MNRETLIAELNRLLDLGEPLLDVFPKRYPDYWALELPDNISEAMDHYAYDVTFRAWNCENYRQQNSAYYLAKLVKDLEAGLLGWRAVGVLK